MCRCPTMKVPSDHVSLVIQAAAHLDDHRRTERFPGMLVGAHPLDAHWLSGGLGEQRGISGGVIGGVVAIAVGSLDVDNANVSRRKAEELSDGRAQLMSSLRCRPDSRLSAFHLSDG